MAGKWMVTRARKITPNTHPGTLYYRTGESADEEASVPYTFVRVKPMDETFYDGGFSEERALLTFFQEGAPSVAPFSGCRFVDYKGRNWLIGSIHSKHQWEDNWGVYNAECVRVPKPAEIDTDS